MLEFSEHLSDEDASALDRLSLAIVLAQRNSKSLPEQPTLKQEVFHAFSRVAFREAEVIQVLLTYGAESHAKGCWPHVRILFETYTQACFIATDLDARLELYTDYVRMDLDRTLNNFKAWLPGKLDALEKLRQAFKPVKDQVESNYPKPFQWAGLTLAEMSKRVGLYDDYRVIYSLSSQEVHSSWMAVGNAHVDVSGSCNLAGEYFVKLLALCAHVLDWDSANFFLTLARGDVYTNLGSVEELPRPPEKPDTRDN